MFSSFFPWEFIHNFPNLLQKDQPGLYAFSCYDPFLEKVFLNTIPSHYLEEGNWKVLSPEEVTADWLDNNLKTLDFFSSHQSYKILMSENLSAKAQEFLLQEDIDWGKRYFLLTFQKENKFFDKLKKAKGVTSLKIKEPRFWEMGKLLKFLCDQTGVHVNYDVQNYILDAVPNEPGEFIHALKELALLGKEPKKLTLNEARQVLVRERLDQFELARLWGEKKRKLFFNKLLEQSEDFQGQMNFYRFLQGHILKVTDPSYINHKDRASKYDHQIKGQAGLWSQAELRDELKFFGQCEIWAKEKSAELERGLKLKILESYQ